MRGETTVQFHPRGPAEIPIESTPLEPDTDRPSVKTRCPTCKTRYEITPEALLEADGLARCFRCGTIFETVAEDIGTPNVIQDSAEQAAFELGEQSELASDDAAKPQTAAAAPEPDTQTEAPASSVVRADEAREPALPDAPAETPAPDETTDEASVQRLPESVEDLLAQAQKTRPPPTEKTEPEAVASTDSSPDENTKSEEASKELPFAVPENLEPLEPSPDVALDVTDTLYEKKSRRGFFYGLIAVILITGLGLQLAWQQRKELLAEYPFLQPLCEHIECIPDVIHAPDKISILQRDIRPTANVPGSLTLSAKMRNDADTAQALPDIHLSLVDNNGAILIRRRLSPTDYLFPTPPPEKVIAPGEVVTIKLDFEDPGYQASGFVIDFL